MVHRLCFDAALRQRQSMISATAIWGPAGKVPSDRPLLPNILKPYGMPRDGLLGVV